MRSLRLLFVFVVLAISLNAAWTPTCTSFVYVNGINTSNLDAAKTVTDFLQPQFLTYLTSKGKAGSCYSVHLSYNQTDRSVPLRIPLDFVEAAGLWLLQDSALQPYVDNELALDGASLQIQSAYVYASTTTPATDMVKVFGKTSQSTAVQITVLPFLTTEEKTTLDLLVTNLLREIETGHSAVCIGHSEGNFYCNLAYRVIQEDSSNRLRNLGLLLPDKKVLQTIGIATPADFTADSRNEYVTVCKDFIAGTPKSLPPNYPSISSCGQHWWDVLWSAASQQSWANSFVGFFITAVVGVHEHYIETYLAPGTGTQLQIMQMMENALTPPTITILGPNNSDDVWVNSYTAYYGGGMDNDELRIGGWGDQYQSLFKFNLPSTPFIATKAELRFYKYAEGGARSQIYLDRVTSTWTESTKWMNKPTSVNLSTLPQPADNQWYTIDITSLYNSWQNGSYPNYGIMLRPTSVSNDVHNTFRSSEYVDANFRPQLVLTSAYSSPPPTNTRPTITLSGANPMSVNVGTQFVEPGYTATDAEDGNITAKVTISGSVNTATIGTYTLTYNVSDSAGLSAISQTRTVNVVTSVVSGTTTYTLTSSLCSVVWVTSSYYNYGQHDADMRVGGWGDSYYSLLKCNQASMPTNATEAVLRLYAYPSPSGGSRGQMYLDRITSTWDNSTKWQTKPTSVNISTLPASVDNQWYEIDITALYNSWQSGSFVNYGIMLRPLSVNNVFNFFRSPEYTVSAFQPQLVVTTTTGTPPPAPLTGACAANNASLVPITLQVGDTGYFGAGYSGGTLPIHFLWTGAVGGDISNAYQVYSSPGTYNVSVRLTDSASPPQQVTVACPQVTVVSPVQSLSASCSLVPNSITLGSSTTMVVGPIGGYSPYTYQFPGDSSFGSTPIKTFVMNSVGTFSYTAYVKDSHGSTVISSPCSVTVNLGTLTATNTVATPNPVRRSTNLLIQLWGSNFLSGTTQVSLLGPGCLLFTSCPIPVTVVSSGYIESRFAVTNPGSYTVWLRNGSGSWILAPVLTFTVTN